MANPTSRHAHCWTNRTSAEGSTTGEEAHTFLKESETPICSVKILKGRPAPTLQLPKLLNVKIGQSVKHGPSIKSIVSSSCTQSFVKRSWGWAEVCYTLSPYLDAPLLCTRSAHRTQRRRWWASSWRDPGWNHPLPPATDWLSSTECRHLLTHTVQSIWSRGQRQWLTSETGREMTSDFLLWLISHGLFNMSNVHSKLS